MGARGEDETTARVRRELSQAAREALTDTHARERRAQLWLRTRKFVAWLAVVGGLAAVGLAFGGVLEGATRTVASCLGASGALAGGVPLALPKLKKRWGAIRRQGAVERVFDDAES